MITIFILSISFISPSSAGNNIQPAFKWHIGEELIYQVKWLFVRIGTMKFQVLNNDSINGRSVYHCRLYLDSNPKLPFVDLHEVYDSYIDEDVYSHGFNILVKKSDYDYLVFHTIDYEQKNARILVKECTPTDTTIYMDSTIVIPEQMQDGLSILYFSRAFAHKQELVQVPVLSFKEIHSAHIRFTGEIDYIKYKDQHIPSYYLDGMLKFIGIGGIKEDFKGWFSTDAQRVPLKAEMKAFIGSVKIELGSWDK